MPRYYDIRNITLMFDIPIKIAKKIAKDYEDVLIPSPFSTSKNKFYSEDVADLFNKIYQRSMRIKDEKKLREVMKLPEKKEQVKEEKPAKPKAKQKSKGVESILFELFKARLEEYLQAGIITKSQFNELMEYEKEKV